MREMKNYFEKIAGYLQSLKGSSERYTLFYEGEESEFIRFNKALIRQAGHVTQHGLTIDLIEGKKHVIGSINLCGDIAEDQTNIKDLVIRLREKLRYIPEDPFFLFAEKVSPSSSIQEYKLTPPQDIVRDILSSSKGLDFVGILATGSLHAGFANSLGQFNWHTAHNFNLDWCLYRSGDKAVKSNYAGTEWDKHKFISKIKAGADNLNILSEKPIVLSPGDYRAYLSPSAFSEIFSLLSWNSFSYKSLKTRNSCLVPLFEEKKTFSPKLTVLEDQKSGLSPSFTAHGFIKPSTVELIKKGKFVDSLISPRSGVEFDKTNNSDDGENPTSLRVLGGNLDDENILSRLGTGVFINNLWYLNFSDRFSGRITGMTRFATFWVEDGKIKAPINVMRFDESLYDLLGDSLEDLGRNPEFMPSNSTYFKRSSSSETLPGALVKKITFTL